MCRYWLSCGLLIFLTGFFWAPSQHHYKLIVTDLLLFPALLAAFSANHWRKLWRKCGAIALLGAYLVYFSANDLWHKNEDASEYIQWSAYLVLFFFAIGQRLAITDDELLKLFSIAAGIAAAAGLFAIAADIRAGVFLQQEYRLIGYGALYNPLRSAEVFGVFAVIGTWCALIASSAIIRWTAVAASCVCFATVLFTGSRSPLIGLLLAALYIVYSEAKGTGLRRWLAALVIASTVVISIFWQALTARGTSLRPEIWGHVLHLCRQQPWFGFGLNSRAEIPTNSGAIFSDTHNIFLNALYSGGIVGLFLLLLLFGTFLRLTWSYCDKPMRRLIFAWLIYSFMTLQFDGGSLLGRPGEFWLLLWLPLALCIRSLPPRPQQYARN